MRFEEGMWLVVIGYLVRNVIKNFKICIEIFMVISQVYVYVVIFL